MSLYDSRSGFSSGFGRVALTFGDTGGLAAAAAQIIQLRAADLALAHDGNRIDQRREHREHALHAFAIGDLADGEALIDARTLTGDADAFEGLQTLARLHLLGLFVIGLFDDLHVDLQRVARTECRKRLLAKGLHLLGFELLNDIHCSSPKAGQANKSRFSGPDRARSRAV